MTAADKTLAREATLASVLAALEAAQGSWGYHSGSAGTLALSGGKRVLLISAVALGQAASVQINGGDTIALPYDAGTGASTAVSLPIMGNLTDPTIVFTGTASYTVQFVT